MVCEPLQLHKTTDILGQSMSVAKGTSEKALLMVANAGFGCLSRVVRPKSQSSIS